MKWLRSFGLKIFSWFRRDLVPVSKTGNVCVESGDYAFHLYTDGTAVPEPTKEEKIIPLDKGDRFPPINSSNKACFWILHRQHI